MKKIILFSLTVLLGQFFLRKGLVAQEIIQSPPSAEAIEEVQIEEYVPKVILEGKWGTGAGEFGKYYDPNEAEILKIAETPQSMAVNSKSEIYILDHLNNRIQKFDKEGKYLLSIPIEGCTNENGNSAIGVKISQSYKEGKVPIFYCKEKIFTKGINIVIDSQDNLYYYCIKGEKGEVWQFKEDKLVKKWEVPVGGSISAGQGMVLDDIDDSIWIFSIDKEEKDKRKFGRSYEVKKRKIYTRSERGKRQEKIEGKYKEQKIKKTTPLERRRQFRFEVTNEGIKVYRVKVIKK